MVCYILKQLNSSFRTFVVLHQTLKCNYYGLSSQIITWLSDNFPKIFSSEIARIKINYWFQSDMILSWLLYGSYDECTGFVQHQLLMFWHQSWLPKTTQNSFMFPSFQLCTESYSQAKNRVLDSQTIASGNQPDSYLHTFYRPRWSILKSLLRKCDS